MPLITHISRGKFKKSGAHSDILQTVQVPITSTRRCNEHFGKHNVEISEGTQMCAGVEGRDSCQGSIHI